MGKKKKLEFNLYPERILDYRLSEDLELLSNETRYNSMKNKKFSIMLTGGNVIRTSPQRCLINLYISRILDYYGVRDNLKSYIFTSSFSKGKPYEYKKKVLWNIKKDSHFSSLPESDYVILLPHLLAEITEAFYRISFIVNGIVMTNHSLYSYIKGYKTDKEFRNMLDNPIINVNDPIWEIDEKMQKALDKYDTIINVEPLSSYYKSGVKVNRQQLMLWNAWGYTAHLCG